MTSLTYLKTLRKERNDILNEVRSIAAKATEAGRGFTEDEDKRADELLAKAAEKNVEIERAEDLHDTASTVGASLSKAAEPMTARRTNASALGDLFAKGLGLPVSAKDGRQHFDADGKDRDRKAEAPGITDAPRGRITVPTLRTAAGGGIFWAPAVGASFLDLMPLNPLGPKDTTYKVRRQVPGDRPRDAAHTVRPGQEKPSATIPWETVENRARQFAVLSEPLNVADFKDVPFFGQDAANLLALDLIWAIESCIVGGNQDTPLRDDFDGLTEITGVRHGEYRVNPWRSIRSAITAQEAAGYAMADLTIHIRPEVWEDIETATTEDGKPLFDNLATGSRREPILYGVPVRLSQHVPDGQAIVGAWGTTQLNVRDGIELDWSDDGLFNKNQLRLRSETRVSVDFTIPGAFRITDLEPTA